MSRKKASERRGEKREELLEARREFIARIEGLPLMQALIAAQSLPAVGWVEHLSGNLAYFINVGCVRVPYGCGRWEREYYKTLVKRWMAAGELPPDTLEKYEADLASSPPTHVA